MKGLWKSANTWRSYGQESGVLFFWLTVYTVVQWFERRICNRDDVVRLPAVALSSNNPAMSRLFTHTRTHVPLTPMLQAVWRTLWVKKVRHWIFVETSSKYSPIFTARCTQCKARYCYRNGFNQTAIVLRYSAHIKQRKTIKVIKTENITQKKTQHDAIVSSQSIAVNK